MKWKQTTLVVRILKELNENFNGIKKNIETIKNQSEIKKTISEMKNTLEGVNSRLDEAEDQISDLEENVAKNTQSEQQEEKYVYYSFSPLYNICYHVSVYQET